MHLSSLSSLLLRFGLNCFVVQGILKQLDLQRVWGKLCYTQNCKYRSIPVGTAGKSRTGVQTRTRNPLIPPQKKFRPISVGILISAGIINNWKRKKKKEKQSPVQELSLLSFFFLCFFCWSFLSDSLRLPLLLLSLPAPPSLSFFFFFFLPKLSLWFSIACFFLCCLFFPFWFESPSRVK